MKHLTKTNYHGLALGPLVFLCLISIFGAITYRIYSLNKIGVIISLILAVISFFIILRLDNIHNKDNFQFFPPQRDPAKAVAIFNFQLTFLNSLLLVSYFSLLTSCFYILLSHRTASAIISPWQVIPPYFFIVCGLATAILAVIIIRLNEAIKQFNNLTISLLTFHYFLFLSVALIVYKIGFGFDPFIHQATVDLINKTGVVEPKPFYYLGQYALLVIAHKITAASLVWLDKLLVPVLASLYLPLILFQALKKLFNDKKSALLTILMVLILPLSFFIVATPQNFAYLLLILVIILGLTGKNTYDFIVIYVLALAATAFHPIAGIPALLFSLLLTACHSGRKKLKKYFYLIIPALAITALPFLFYLLEKNNLTASENRPALREFPSNALAALRLSIPGQENFVLNFIYLYGFNLKFIIGLIAIAGIIIAYRRRENFKILSIYLLMSASLAGSYLLAKNLPFSFLIDYERNNYSDRIILMALFFLLPFILIALYGLTNAILKQKRSVKIPLLIFIIILIATSLYLTYPRHDRYFNSRGFSTGQNDIDAVRWIEGDARGDYIVLANQQVSAAALREFGFKKYYTPPLLTKERDRVRLRGESIFYYPIPTGGPLYQYYLDMVYKKPSRETINAAMDLGGVQKAYFVLNKYWWALPKVLEEAKLEADNWQEFGDGEVYLFEYKR